MATQPLRKYVPMHGSSIDEQDIAADTILESDIADDAITSDKIIDDAVIAGKMAADAIPNTAAIVKIISPDAFDTAALVDVIADDAFDEATVDALFAAGAIDAADRLKAASIGSDRIISGTIADDRMSSSLVKDEGAIAVGRLDFAGVATAASTITIGAATYLEADAEDFPNGQWTNGATANNSATSLVSAINGDTRNGGGAYYAAVLLTDTVFVFALAIGIAGNVSMSTSAGEPASIENMIGGLAVAVKQVAHIMHTVTTLEVAVAGTAPEVLIPLPFDATFFSWRVYDSTGGIYATEITARGTVTVAASPIPAYFRLANNGAADLQAGDIIRLVIEA